MAGPRLEVSQNGQSVGHIQRALEPEPHRFRYLPGIPPAAAVSLLVPPAEVDYFAAGPGVLHPVFAMNLPEGDLRQAIAARFSRDLPTVFDDYALLGLVGRSQIGRLRYAASESQPPERPLPLSIPTLLQARGTRAVFNELFERYLTSAGVSGVQPKVLVQSEAPAATPGRPVDRLTFPETTHIIKAFDPARWPDLAVNEHLCLLASGSAGLPTAKVQVADDGGVLVVERFDRDPAGLYLGFEDICSLSGRLPEGKYEGSYEDVADLVARLILPQSETVRELRKFFKTLVLSVGVRNGDAHLKNFGVLYANAETGPVTLAPVFDVITTTAYLDRDRMALSLGGRKEWPSAKRLIEFGIRHCHLTPADARAAVQEVVSGIANARGELTRVTTAFVRQKMEAEWAYGLELDPPAAIRTTQRK